MFTDVVAKEAFSEIKRKRMQVIYLKGFLIIAFPRDQLAKAIEKITNKLIKEHNTEHTVKKNNMNEWISSLCYTASITRCVLGHRSNSSSWPELLTSDFANPLILGLKWDLPFTLYAYMNHSWLRINRKVSWLILKKI